MRTSDEHLRGQTPYITRTMKKVIEQNGSLHVVTGSKKIKLAFFDMDNTIISTISGRKFPKDEFDWKWLFECVPDKLRWLWKHRYVVGVFTNQAKNDSSHAATITRKIEAIIDALGIPIQFYMATTNDTYRKPYKGMWEDMLERNNITPERVSKHSFYCGDAAGRKGDFSDSDRAFAWNCGITFHTPEEYFQGADPLPYEWTMPNPNQLIAYQIEKSDFIKPIVTNDAIEVVIFVGLPSCGKSMYYKHNFEPNGYVHVNRDTCGTMKKCQKICRESLESGKSVVIDNTNVTVEHREQFITIAMSLGIPCRCVVFRTDARLVQHLKTYRRMMTGKSIPTVTYHTMTKKYVKPTLDEGFTDISEGIVLFDSKLVGQLFFQRTSVIKREIWWLNKNVDIC